MTDPSVPHPTHDDHRSTISGQCWVGSSHQAILLDRITIHEPVSCDPNRGPTPSCP